MTMRKDHIKLANRWLKHVIQGEGPEKSEIGKFRYDGAIFYYEDSPSQRLLKSKHNQWGHLVRWYSTETPGWAKAKVTIMHVPDLAVFSKYSGDWYADADDVHNRIKYIHLMEAGVLAEETYKLRADQCVSGYVPKQLLGKIQSIEKKWNEYDAFYHLGWGWFPSHYEETMQQTIEHKKTAWESPEAVAKRERARARAAAKQALGLDQ